MNSGPNINNGENSSNTSKNTSTSLIISGVRDFVDSEINSDGGGEFYEKAIKGTSKNKLIDEFRKFINTERYAGLHDSKLLEDSKKDDLFDIIKKEMFKAGVNLESRRGNLISIIRKRYDLSSIEKTRGKKIEEEIHKMSPGEIDNVISSEKNTTAFLKKSLGEGNIPLKQDFSNFLNSTLGKGVKLNKSQTEAVESLFYKFRTVTIDDVVEVINLFPNEKDKKVLIQEFVPTVKLKDLQSSGLLDKKKLEELKKKELESFIENITRGDAKFGDLSDDDKKFILKSLNVDDLVVSTKDILGDVSVDNILKSDNLMNIIASELNSMKNEVEKGLEIDSFDKFINAIKKDANLKNKVQGIDNFKDGSVVELKIKGKNEKGEDTEVTKYFEIKNNQVDGKKVAWFSKGEGEKVYEYIGRPSLELNSYDDLITLFNSDKVGKSEIHTNSQFESKSRNFKSEQVQGFGVSQATEDEINNLQSEIDKKKYKLAKLKKQANQETDLQKLKELDKEIAELEESLDIDYNNIVNTQFLSEDLSLQGLKDLINGYDTEGKKFELGKGTVFRVKFDDKKGPYWDFAIDSIDHKKRTVQVLSQGAKIQTFSYEQFAEFFKDGAIRTGKIEDGQGLLNSIKSYDKNNDKVKKAWEGFEFDSTKKMIVNSSRKGDEEYKGLEYLLSDGSDKEDNTLVKINEISGNFAIIQIGEWEENGKKKEEKGHGDHGKGHKDHGHGHGHGHEEKKGPKYNFKIKGAKTQKVPLSFLYSFINQKKLTPKEEEGNEIDELNKKSEEGRKGSFISKFFANLSVHEIIHGVESIGKSIKHALEKGSHANSAHLALTLGKFLPQEIENELLMQVEAEEQKAMEDIKKQLKSVDSPIAAKMILSFLQNKDCPEYKKEAALIYMFENYGTLYGKGGKNGLIGKKGTWLWYKAMGGVVGDKIWKETKESCDNMKPAPVQFTEEEAVFRLIQAQCNTEAHHPSGIHRRSRLHKELKATWPAGISSEREKGEKDGKDIRSCDKIVDNGISELKGGTFNNAWGFLDAAVNRGGDIKTMNKIPFVMLFSGDAYSYDGRSAAKMKGYMNNGEFLLAMRFISYVPDIEIFNKTVLELSKRITKLHTIDSNYSAEKFAKMGARAQKIFDIAHGKEFMNHPDKITETAKFWDDYGDVLIRALDSASKSEDGLDEKYARSDKMIFLEKDEPDGEIFKQYHEKSKGFIHEASFDKEEDIMDHWRDTGITGIALHKIGEYNFTIKDGGFMKKKSGPMFWDEIVNEIKSVKNKIYTGTSINSEENKRAQKKLLKHYFREFISAIILTNGTNLNTVMNYAQTGGDLRSMGIDLNDFKTYKSEDIREGGSDNLINQIVDNLMVGGGIKHTSNNIKNQESGRVADLLGGQ